jgi:antitoxin YefM
MIAKVVVRRLLCCRSMDLSQPARRRTCFLLLSSERKQEIIAIIRSGVPSAVLLSMDQFQGMMETIEILSDQKTMRGLRLSLRQAEKGQWVSHDRVFSDPAYKPSW